MPRFTPWRAGTPPDLSEPDVAIEKVIRPGLRLAFPLPAADHSIDDRFRLLLDALAQRRTESG